MQPKLVDITIRARARQEPDKRNQGAGAGSVARAESGAVVRAGAGAGTGAGSGAVARAGSGAGVVVSREDYEAALLDCLGRLVPLPLTQQLLQEVGNIQDGTGKSTGTMWGKAKGVSWSLGKSQVFHLRDSIPHDTPKAFPHIFILSLGCRKNVLYCRALYYK